MKALFALTAAAMIASPALAVNNGFETGDTTGWTASSNAFAASVYGVFAPTEGSFLGVAQGGNGEGVYATLSQTFVISAGGSISGFVGFQANDYLPYDDDGFLSVGNTTLFTASVGSVGIFGNTGWQSFSFVAPTTGFYTLTLAARNNLDNGFNSFAVLDGVKVGGVPEPTTWAMLIAGFGLVGAAARRRRTAIA